MEPLRIHAPEGRQQADGGPITERRHGAWGPLERNLRRALERDEFFLHYQPKLDLAKGRICGAEALLRWDDPERGPVLPGEFVPVLEETGLILPVGLWVMETACRQMARWRQAGLQVPPVAINLSARQLQGGDLHTQIARIIVASGVPPELIELEITESMLMAEPHQAAETLRKLKDLGIGLSVDDFGTGYSSLAYLKRFPLDALKIDRAFVRDITSDPDDAAIALAIIKLAHSLRLKVVAEGVETEGQYHFLHRHRCDMLQGYYVSLPLSAEDYARLLTADVGKVLPQPSPPARQVLVLDDMGADNSLIEQALAGEGYGVIRPTALAEAFEQLARHAIQMVIVNPCGLRMSGIEFLSRVKQLYPDVIRVLHLEQEGCPMVTEAVNHASVHKVISKQWAADAIRQTLRAALRQGAWV